MRQDDRILPQALVPTSALAPAQASAWAWAHLAMPTASAKALLWRMRSRQA